MAQTTTEPAHEIMQALAEEGLMPICAPVMHDGQRAVYTAGMEISESNRQFAYAEEDWKRVVYALVAIQKGYAAAEEQGAVPVYR